MKTLIPSVSACFVVALVSSVSYAEINLGSEDIKEVNEESSVVKVESKTLSVAPLDHVTYPQDRPTWIRDEPDLESEVHTWAITTTGCESMETCESELNENVRASVAVYVQDRTGWNCDEEFLDQDWIEDKLIVKRYVGTLQKGDRTLNEIAVQLEFDAEAQERIDRAWRNYQVGDRLRATGGLFALGLLGLCCSGGLLSLVSRRYGS